MISNIPVRIRIALGVAAVLGVVAFPFLYSACTPGNDITNAESDVVVTLYDETVNFSALKTYFMPDTIVHLTGDPSDDNDPNLPRTNDAFVLSQVASQLAKLNYVRQPTSTGVDFIVAIGATSTNFYSVYSYWPCYYCGGCCWYPYYPTTGVSYAYSTGTILVLMADPNFDGNSGSDVYWSGGINGVLNDTQASITSRLQNTINQMFVQSPYLGTTP